MSETGFVYRIGLALCSNLEVSVCTTASTVTDSPHGDHHMRPKPKRRLPPEVLSQDEVGALLEACGNKDWRGLPDRAMIVGLYSSGL